MKNKIAITTTTFAEHDLTPLLLLEKNNLEIKRNDLSRTLKKEEILVFCSGCIGIIAGTEPYDQDALNRLPGLKVISRCGAGTDNIDLNIAKGLGIKVTNTPDAPTLAVAELTVGLIFNLLRHISFSDREVRNSIWKKHMGTLIYGKNIGIIGLGKIGKKVAELLAPFKTNIAYFDIAPDAYSTPYIRKNLDDLLAWADIITIHCTVKENAKAVIGSRELKKLKKGAVIINTARGGLIDEEALYEKLSSGEIAGAGLDTFHKEPYQGKLKELDNVILTPHIGSYAKESRIEMEIEATSNLLKNLPEVKR